MHPAGRSCRYPLLKLQEMPRVETHIVPSGGEIGRRRRDLWRVTIVAPAGTDEILAALGRFALYRFGQFGFGAARLFCSDGACSVGSFVCTNRYQKIGAISSQGGDDFLSPNEQRRHSVQLDLAKEPDGGFVIRASARPQPGNWLPLGGAVTCRSRCGSMSRPRKSRRTQSAPRCRALPGCADDMATAHAVGSRGRSVD